MKLYGYWRSSASYRVRIALNLKQLDFDYEPVHLVQEGGQQFQEAYHSLNPSHLVPTFVDEDEDIILNQSLAIIEYLDERYDERVPLLPAHKSQRARIKAMALDLAADIQPVANLRVLKYLEQNFSADAEQKAQWCRHWIEQGFAGIEQRLVKTAGKYCFGFDVTLADVCLVPQVYNAKRFRVDMSQFPLIEQIDNNCNELEAFKQALPENQPDSV